MRPWRRAWLFSLPLLLFTACYEEVEGCLDPDATNFSVTSDVACADGCCDYPRLSLQVAHLWGDELLGADSVRQDGAGNDFIFDRFRFYLGSLELETDGGFIGVPSNVQELGAAAGAGAAASERNVNAALITTTSGAAIRVGTLPIGSRDPTALLGTYGLPDNLQDVLPSTAPSGSPLRTQPGLLNFNDDRGYVQGKLDYRFPGDTTPFTLSFYGVDPLVLAIDTVVPRLRFDDVTLELVADHKRLFEGVNLRADSSAAAAAIGENLPGILRITGY